MNEQLIRSIIRLYGLLAGLDGLANIEKTRIEQFLSHHLSGRSVAVFLQLLEKVVAQLETKEKKGEWIEKELDDIAKVVNLELKLDQKYYLFLELVELSNLDLNISPEEKSLLEKIPSRFHIGEKECQILLEFGMAQSAAELDKEFFLLISGKRNPSLQNALYKERPGLQGEVVVLKIPDSETLFVRYFGEKEASLNGQRMNPGMVMVWAPGSTLRQPGIDPIFFTDIREKFSSSLDRPAIQFDVQNIEYRFPNGKIGLHKMSLSEKGGRMIAIMGASGSGKSTLFNVLNGNDKPQKGKVLINGKNLHTKSKELEGIIGYVPQDELLNEHLSVYQNLYFAARFCLAHLAEEDIQKLVVKMLHSLCLPEDIWHLEVGSTSNKTISGGQRKRLNIALELIRQPSILFVDEPTSGLSSRDSVTTMELLKDLALGGKLVFVIIHQPSPDIFKMFDRLIVLDYGGHLIYYGNTLEAIPYFREKVKLPVTTELADITNAAEIFDIAEAKVLNEMGVELDERKRQPKEWAQLFQEHKVPETLEKASNEIPKTIHKPGFFQQAILYFRRDFLSKIKDLQYLTINLLEAPFLALVLGIAVHFSPWHGFYHVPYLFSLNENMAAYFFMSVIIALFIGLSVSAEEIIRDRLQLKREKFLHLSWSSYLTAKITLLFAVSAFQTWSFVAISCWLLEIRDIAFWFWIVLFSSACCANLLGLVLSDTFRKAVVVYIIIPLLLIPQLVFGGVVVNYDKLNPFFGNLAKVPVLGESMISRWAYEALMVAQFTENAYQKIAYPEEKEMADAHYKRSYYLSELRNLVSAAYLKQDSITEEWKLKNELTYKELCKEGNRFGMAETHWTPVKDRPFPEKDYQSIMTWLDKFSGYYNLKYEMAEKKLNHKRDSIGKLNEDKDFLFTIKSVSENERIRDILTNANLMDSQIETTKEGIIRKASPIFHDPEPCHSVDFRTHFFSPKKYFGGKLIPSPVFNLIIIWLISFFTALILWNRWAKKGLHFLGLWTSKWFKTERKG
jgi:ABC-type multidrug transport system ATPase subunit